MSEAELNQVSLIAKLMAYLRVIESRKGPEALFLDPFSEALVGNINEEIFTSLVKEKVYLFFIICLMY